MLLGLYDLVVDEFRIFYEFEIHTYYLVFKRTQTNTINKFVGFGVTTKYSHYSNKIGSALLFYMDIRLITFE